MALDLTALKAEIQDDPTGRGYAPFVARGHTGGVAALLNEVVAGKVIQRNMLAPQEVWEAISLSEFTALSDPGRQALGIILGIEEVDVGPGSNSRATLAALFPGGSTTRAALLALVRRDGSRAEELFGVDTVISHRDVGLALGGP